MKCHIDSTACAHVVVVQSVLDCRIHHSCGSIYSKLHNILVKYKEYYID